MIGFRNQPVYIFALILVFPPNHSLETQISPSKTPKDEAYCNYGGFKTIRFFPGLSADIGVCNNIITEQDRQCYDDSRILQQNARNYTLWASLMVDATAAYPTGVLYGSRYHFGNFDGCMAAAKKSPVGARYCLTRLTYNDRRSQRAKKVQSKSWTDWEDLDPNDDVRDMLQGLGRTPQEMSPRDIWMGVCVPKSCGAMEVQQNLQQELQLWHPNLAAVDIPSDMCTEDENSVSLGLILYSLVIVGLIGVAATATVCELNGILLPAGVQWIRYWSVPQRLKGLLAPEKPIRGVPLESLAGVRIITVVLITISHYCMHLPRAPALNTFITRKRYMDPIAAVPSQAYVFIYTMLFLSGLFLSLGSKETFFRSVILRYLRLTPSLIAVVAFYALAFPSIGSGPLWKSMINIESESCANLWWSNLLYLNNFIRPNAAHGCVLQSWSLAADMQLCIMGTLLLIAERKWKRAGLILLICAIVLFMWVPFLTTLLGAREPVWRFSPSVLEDIWAWPLWDKYVSTEQWALPYLVGLAIGIFLEKLVREGKGINLRTKVKVLLGATVMMVLLILSGMFWNFYEIEQHSVLAALYASFLPTAWSMCLVIVSISLAVGPQMWLDSLLKSTFFVSMSRLSYSIYLIHFGAQIANVAVMRGSSYFTRTGITISALQDLILILPLCLLMYLLIEAPTRELSKDLFKSNSKRPQCEHKLRPQTPKNAEETETRETEKDPTYANT